MRIVKWKPIQQWKPPTFTFEQIEAFACNNWPRLPNSIASQLKYTVQESGFLRNEIVVSYNNLTTQMIRQGVRVDLKHNPTIGELAVKLMEIIVSAVNVSANHPAPILVEIIYAMDEPSRIGSVKPEIWLFKGDIYLIVRSDDEAFYSADQVALLMLEFYDKDRRKWEELSRKYSSDEVERESYHRERIPEDVRIAVWRRDGGKCARCGSREKLEYDHIVPVSKGGGNTARNIELLCESCNRKKSNNIE